ncbi:lysozyme inhibitor LprI family protein [Paracoccus denitrificans]|uniref:lysozyme inhibitor LprI family protein n=1 Tax=Paracoccus denitrificans TaxID=266 RepID=UPI000CEC557D|nr:lysozyme inhibitor LprI family protein [Paracoccus denitrificans]UFS67177.1 lysozyme inhibitor LprI family protein [Paracoccus denitrificans]
MKAVFLATALSGLSLLPAYAADCMDSATTQTAMTACAAQLYQAADADLNKTFHEIRQRIGDDAQTQSMLRSAERNWIAFRDAECAFAASAGEGGSAYTMTSDLCLADITTARVKQLRKYLSCAEGDTTCPVPAN